MYRYESEQRTTDVSCRGINGSIQTVTNVAFKEFMKAILQHARKKNKEISGAYHPEHKHAPPKNVVCVSYQLPEDDTDGINCILRDHGIHALLHPNPEDVDTLVGSITRFRAESLACYWQCKGGMFTLELLYKVFNERNAEELFAGVTAASDHKCDASIHYRWQPPTRRFPATRV